MRRESRRSKETEGGLDTRKMLYIAGTILALAVIAFVITFIVYGNTLNESSTELGKLNSSISNTYANDKAEETSTSYGKTVNEVKESDAKNNSSNTEKVAVNTSNAEKNKKNEPSSTKTAETKTKTTKSEEVVKTE